MSKNTKRKNTNYKTNKSQQKASTTKPGLSKLTILLLAAVIIIGAIVGYLVLKPDEYAQRVPENAPAEAKLGLEYLEKKYGRKFEYVDESTGGYWLYTTGEGNDIVAVCYAEMLTEFLGYDKNDFSGTFADNAYFFIKQQEIIDFYAKLLPDTFGNYRIIPYYDTIAMPSKVDHTVPAATAIYEYDDYMVPHLFIATDVRLNEEQIANTIKAFEDTGLKVMLRVLYAPLEDHAGLRVSSLVKGWNKNENVLISENINIDMSELFPDEFEDEEKDKEDDATEPTDPESTNPESTSSDADTASDNDAATESTQTSSTSAQ